MGGAGFHNNPGFPIPQPGFHHPMVPPPPHHNNNLFGDSSVGGAIDSRYMSGAPSMTGLLKKGAGLPTIAHTPSKPVVPNPNPKVPVFSNTRPELPPPKWYASVVPLGLDDDKHYLSELQCVLRHEFVEVFGTSQVSNIIDVFSIVCISCARFANVGVLFIISYLHQHQINANQ